MASDDKHTHRPRLPVIPDLRFEYSYLRSIRPYVQIEKSIRASGASATPNTDTKRRIGGWDTTPWDEEELSDFSEQEKPTQAEPLAAPSSEVVRIEWQKVLWVTVRDQVISPLLQGALWALASYWITPLSSRMGSRVGSFVHEHLPTKEGLGVGWLRKWGQNLGLSTGTEPSFQIARTIK